MTIEIVVYTIDAAMSAQKGGADRIELCDNPAEGGTTPSLGVIELVRQAVTMDVFVMIRPRGGDFMYSNYEYYAMKRDIEQCKRASVDGVVLGILTQDGTLDKVRCKKLIEAARPLKVTCHRAFDVTRDPFEALEDCIEVGFDRILTSGRQQSAEQGIPLITELVKKAGNRISIMAGSGVNEKNALKIVEETGIQEIHFSATRFDPPAFENFNPAITFTSEIPQDYLTYRTADPEIIKRASAILRL